MDTPRLLRPLGVTVLGVAQIIGGIFTLIVGAFSIGVSSIAADYILSNQLIAQNSMLTPDVFTHSFIEGVITFIGISALFIGAANLLISYGLLKGAEWGRLTVIIFASIGVVLSLIFIASDSLGFAAMLLVNGYIIYYLTRPRIVGYYRSPK